LEAAEQQYVIAERGAATAEDAIQFRVAERLGDVLMLRGFYEQAEGRLQQARLLAGDDFDRARIEGKLGELAFKRGEWQDGSTAIERGLRLLGRVVPHRTLFLVPLVAWEVLTQVLHSTFPRYFLARRPPEGSAAKLLAVRLYTRLSYAYWFQEGSLPCLWAHLRGMNVAERYAPSPELAHVYSAHAPMMSALGRFRRGIDYAQRSLAMRKSFDDLWGQGQSLNFYAVVLYASSEFVACLEKSREAVALLERTGDRWEICLARFHVAFSLYRLGLLREAVAEARRIRRSAIELGDPQMARSSYDVWAKAAGGNVAFDWPDAREGTAMPAMVTSQVLQAKGVWHIRHGRYAEAVESFEVAGKVGAVTAWTAPAFAWLATALRMASSAIRAADPTRSSALLRRAKKAATRALSIGRRFQNDLPHALREMGLVLAEQNCPDQALVLLDRSASLAERQGACYELAQTIVARSLVRLRLNRPGAAEQLTAAQEQLSKFETFQDETSGEDTFSKSGCVQE
jgi:two-component system sensor kinase